MNYLFNYLNRLGIALDKKEFEFQLQTHPSGHTLLGVSDTLNFMHVKNGVYEVPIEAIDELPEKMIALLSKNEKDELFFVERVDNYYKIIGDEQQIISIAEIQKRWRNVVLAIDEEVLLSVKKPLKIKKKLIFLIPILYFLIIFWAKPNLYFYILYALSLLGLMLAAASMKELFGMKSKFVDNFCSISGTNSCAKLSKSTKWTIFKYVGFGDAGVVFFGYQLLGLLLYANTDYDFEFLQLQSGLLLLSIPFILVSIYYQKFVEKTFCVICLSIIGVLIIELFLLINRIGLYFPVIPTFYLSNIALITLLTVFWIQIKDKFEQFNQIKSEEQKSKLLVKNYEIFKFNLIQQEKLALPNESLTIGKDKSDLIIGLLINPFCGHCKDAFILAQELIGIYDNLKIQIFFNTNYDKLDENDKNFYDILISQHIERGQDAFSNALIDWFNNRNIESWKSKFRNLEIYKTQIIERMSTFYEWTVENNKHLTPSFFINGFEYPREYQRDWLRYYIPDLLEDEEIKGV